MAQQWCTSSFTTKDIIPSNRETVHFNLQSHLGLITTVKVLNDTKQKKHAFRTQKSEITENILLNHGFKELDLFIDLNGAMNARSVIHRSCSHINHDSTLLPFQFQFYLSHRTIRRQWKRIRLILKQILKWRECTATQQTLDNPPNSEEYLVESHQQP